MKVNIVSWRPPARSSSGRSFVAKGGIKEAGHVLLYHLHIDLQSPLNDAQRSQIDTFVSMATNLGFTMTWENFHRVDRADVERVVSTGSEELTALLVDPQLYGAPTGGHLTCKHSGLPYGHEHECFMDLYFRACELVSDLKNKYGQMGYIELEEVSWRRSFQVEEDGVAHSEILVCPLSNLDKVPLDQMGRDFRTTEIHLTFKDISKVSPKILIDVFGCGFYTAFRKDKDGEKFSTIATIQGFPSEIGTIREFVWQWLVKNAVGGHIQCQVDLKQEDIVAYCLFGQDSKVQQVVNPDSKVLV